MILFLWVFIGSCVLSLDSKDFEQNGIQNKSFKRYNLRFDIDENIDVRQDQQFVIFLTGMNWNYREIVMESCEPSCLIKNNQFIFNGILNPQILIRFKAQQNYKLNNQISATYQITHHSSKSIIEQSTLIGNIQKQQNSHQCQLNFIYEIKSSSLDLNFTVMISRQIRQGSINILFPQTIKYTNLLNKNKSLTCSIKLSDQILINDCQINYTSNVLFLQIPRIITSDFQLIISGIPIQQTTDLNTMKLQIIEKHIKTNFICSNQKNNTNKSNKLKVSQSSCQLYVIYPNTSINIQFDQVQNVTVMIRWNASLTIGGMNYIIYFPQTSSFNSSSSCQTIYPQNNNCTYSYSQNNTMMAIINFSSTYYTYQILITMINIITPQFSSNPLYYSTNVCNDNVNFYTTCSYPCSECNSYSRQQCIACYSGFFLQGSNCVNTCSSGFQQVDGICLPCPNGICNNLIIPLPFTITYFIILFICIISYLIWRKTFFVVMLFSLASIIETLAFLTIFIIFSLSTYVTWVTVTASCPFMFSILISVIQLYGIQRLKNNFLYQKWKQQFSITNLILTILSIFSPRSFYLQFSRAFEIKRLSARIQSLLQFNYLKNVLIASIFTSILIMAESLFIVIELIKIANKYQYSLTFRNPIWAFSLDCFIVSVLTVVPVTIFLCLVKKIINRPIELMDESRSVQNRQSSKFYEMHTISPQSNQYPYKYENQRY